MLVRKSVGFVEIFIFRHFVPAFPCEKREKRALLMIVCEKKKKKKKKKKESITDFQCLQENATARVSPIVLAVIK